MTEAASPPGPPPPLQVAVRLVDHLDPAVRELVGADCAPFEERRPSLGCTGWKVRYNRPANPPATSPPLVLLPPADRANDANVRIFTVRRELPFAGHPNVGTAFVLATQAAKAPARLKFEEKAGLVPVEILTGQGGVTGAELTAPGRLELMSQADAARVAACLSLAASDIRTERHPPQVASVGLPFLIVEVATREAVRRATGKSAQRGRAGPAGNV
jgi:hypothetical protein